MRLRYIKKALFSSDRRVISKKFKKVFGFEPDLNNPKRFNEIINWRKLNERNPLFTTCTDKLLVRKFVASCIGEKYLVPLLASGQSWDAIHYKGLKEPFIIKTTHGSGGNRIIWDKSNERELELKELFTEWLKENYYYGLREWQYKNISPGIVVEELLQDGKGYVPADYKFYCFNYGAEIELIIEVTVGRFQNIQRAFYTEKWEKLPVEFGFPMCHDEISRPSNFDKMCDLTRKLARTFNYVRVDLYSVNDKIYFGELTFSPFSGLMKIKPDKWDFIFGEKLIKTGILEQK
jgi:hypothetical protein